MNKEFRVLATTIIKYHKENNGHFMWGNSTPDLNEYAAAQLDSCKNLLIDKGFIKENSNSKAYTSLTNKGWDFESFDKEDEAANEVKRIEKLSADKLEIDYKNAQRVYKTYFSTRAMAIIATIVSVALLLLKLAEVFGLLDLLKQ